jgi:hypothetical protein
LGLKFQIGNHQHGFVAMLDDFSNLT